MMNMEIGMYQFLFAFAMFAIYKIYKDIHDAEDYRLKEQVEPGASFPMALNVEKAFNTRALVVQTLNLIGCHVTQEDEKIKFSYQNETFWVDADDDNQFITIHDPWWYVLPADDIDNFARIRKVVNQGNMKHHFTILYSFAKNEDEELVGLHTKHNMLFNDQISDLEGYMTATLNYFFFIQRNVLAEIEKEKVRDESRI